MPIPAKSFVQRTYGEDTYGYRIPKYYALCINRDSAYTISALFTPGP